MTNISDYIKKETTINAISNTLFNGVIAWLLLRGGDALQWGGEHSFVIDIIATAFILPFIVALIVIPIQRKKIRQDKLPAVQLDTQRLLQRLLKDLPNSTFVNAILFGLAGVLLFAPLSLFSFWVLAIEQIQPNNYAVFKGIWAGLIAAVLVGPMILVGLRPASPTQG